jgi:hypothetical protein
VRSFRSSLVLAAIALPLAAAAEPVRAQAREPVSATASLAPDAGEPARPADSALRREPPPKRRDLGTRMLIGAGVGVAVGAPAGAVYGYARFEPCGGDCLLSRGTETVLHGIMGASAGAVLGALAGALWPGRDASTPPVVLGPAGHQ